MPTLTLPNLSTGVTPVSTVSYDRIVVIVGANGSGKTRLGAWLENPKSLFQNGGMMPPRGNTKNPEVYRIGAQRVLSLNETAERKEKSAVTQSLHQGDGMAQGISRLQGDPIVGQHSDFNLLLSALFAEHADIAEQYMAKGTVTGGNPGVPPKAKLETLKTTWERIFSERVLTFSNYQVGAALVGGAAYGASRLSDGERVGFYLIGQALLAPDSALIVIDEPELHLHECIQGALWDAIEQARTDCRFIYITHDLGFAASRRSATKVALFDYEAPSTPDGVGTWKWTPVPPAEDFPEDTKLRILGSRRHTLFCEGVVGGLDHNVLTAMFPELYVVPVGSWEQVRHAVGSFRRLFPMHHFTVVGVIDRDDHEATAIVSLAKKGVYVLSVAGIENMLLAPPSLRFLCSKRSLKGATPEQTAESVKLACIAHAMMNVGDVVGQRAKFRIRQRLEEIGRAKNTKSDVVKAAEDAAGAAEKIYESVEAEILAALNTKDHDQNYAGAIREFRNKGLLGAAAGKLGISGEDLSETVIAQISHDKTLRDELKNFVPVPIPAA